MEYIGNTIDPPLTVLNYSPSINSGEPFFPAIAACHPSFNLSIDLIQISLGIVGNTSSVQDCYPDDDYCEPNFPTNKINAWKFSIVTVL